MILRSPFFISSRLLPALAIGPITLQIELLEYQGRDGRDRYRTVIDVSKNYVTDAMEHADTNMQSGCQGGSILGGFRSAFSFMLAAAEAHKFRVFFLGGEEPGIDSNEVLFPAPLPELFYQFQDEIELAKLMLDEQGTGLIDES